MDRVERSRNRASHVATEMNFGLPSQQALHYCKDGPRHGDRNEFRSTSPPHPATEMNFGLPSPAA
jgi:hypothetical protein